MDAGQRESIKTRAVAPKVVAHFRDKVADMQPDIEALLREEQQEKERPVRMTLVSGRVVEWWSG